MTNKKLLRDYFKKRSEIIDNLKLKDVNLLASELFNKNDLFFMIVGKRDILCFLHKNFLI